MRRYRSRLVRTIDRRSRRTLLFSLLGIIAVLATLFKVGIPLLVNFSLFIGKFSKPYEEKANNQTFIAPPVLSPLPSATNSAILAVSGKVILAESVKLYLNGELVDKIQVEKDRFSFPGLSLKAGENLIQARAVTKEEKESELSNQHIVVLKIDPPSLTLESPKDQQVFGKDESTILLLGKTDPGTKVTVNDFWAIVDEQGNFSYSLALASGENKIKVIATDEAGNKAEVQRSVTYAP